MQTTAWRRDALAALSHSAGESEDRRLERLLLRTETPLGKPEHAHHEYQDRGAEDRHDQAADQSISGRQAELLKQKIRRPAHPEPPGTMSPTRP